ncbi:hypothetical protein, partial [Nocardioides maradonensis]
TTIERGPVATMPSDQVDAEFSHLMWTNFSGPDKQYDRCGCGGGGDGGNAIPEMVREMGHAAWQVVAGIAGAIEQVHFTPAQVATGSALGAIVVIGLVILCF